MNTDGLKIISINVQDHLNIDRIVPFILSENPDVVCMQEVFDCDFEMYKEKLDMEGEYESAGFVPFPDSRIDTGDHRQRGVAILSKEILVDVRRDYYIGDHEHLELSTGLRDVSHQNRMLLSALVMHRGTEYRIGTTHFPKSSIWDVPDDSVDTTDDYQRTALKAFIPLLNSFAHIALLGDLNSPRGFEIFDALARVYRDHVPADYTSSLDPDLHRIGKDYEYMIDCLFTSHHYETFDTRLVSGVSDHKGIVSTLGRVM